MSEAERPVEPRAHAPRRRRAHRPAGPGADNRAAAGQSADGGSGQRSARQRTGGQRPDRQRTDGQRTPQGEKSQNKQSKPGGQNQAAGQAGQSGQAGPPGEGQVRQGRRRRRGGRGRRGGPGQDGAPDTPRQDTGSDAGESTPSTHTVKSGDGTAGATSARQAPRQARNQSRSRSGSAAGQSASANTTRTSAPAKAGAKSGGKSGSKQGIKAGAKVSGGKNPRGGRAGGRNPRGGQRMRTVLETSAGGLVIRGLAHAAAAGADPDLSRLEVALIGRLDRRGRMLWSMPKGHIEPGETIAETARREVLEETGVDGTVLAPLGIIDYWFVAEGRRIHKTVHHHLIRYDHGELCDEDPEITEVAWVAFADLPKRLAYPDERRLVESARSLLPDLARGELAGQAPEALPSQVVDPSRRAGGPEPVRRSGGGSRSNPPRADQPRNTTQRSAPQRANPQRNTPTRDTRPRGNAPEESGS